MGAGNRRNLSGPCESRRKRHNKSAGESVTGKGKKGKDNWEEGESQVLVPKSGSVALCLCFRNRFQLQRVIHGCAQGQTGLGASGRSQKWCSSNPVAGGLQQDSFKVSSSPPHSTILWIWTFILLPPCSSARPPAPPASTGWEHPAPGEAWPELEEGFFLSSPARTQFINSTGILTSRLGPKDGVYLAQGSWLLWISVNLQIITSSRFSFIPWSLILFLDSLGLSAIFH